MIDDTDERLLGVELAERFEKLFFAHVGGRPRVGRREDAAVHWPQMRREDHGHVAARRPPNDLLNLGRVAMATDVVSRDAFVALREMIDELRRSPGAAD